MLRKTILQFLLKARVFRFNFLKEMKLQLDICMLAPLEKRNLFFVLKT